MNLSYQIKKFFHKEDYDAVLYGINNVRQKSLKILDPFLIIITIVFSLKIQVELIGKGNYKYLFLFYIAQFLLIMILSYFLNSDSVNSSFLFFFLFLKCLYIFLYIHSINLLLSLFISVIISALFFRFKRTAFIYLFSVLFLVVVDRQVYIDLYSYDNWELLSKTPVFYILITAFLAGITVSAVVYYLEQSFERLISLQEHLDFQNNKLSKELKMSLKYKSALMGNELKFKTVLEYAFDGIAILDKDGNSQFISNSTEQITGFSPEEYSEGAITFDRIHPEDLPRVVENFRNISNSTVNNSTIYYRQKHKNGEWRNLEVTVSNLLDNPGVAGILFVYRDVTKHIQAEQRARYFEFYDQLTGLPNQMMFSDKIEEEIERSRARGRSFAVMCLGINSFKDVNSEYGTSFGDMVLKQIGSRLKSNFRGDDLVSRMMGDKFLILFSDMKSENDVIAIVQKTMSSFNTSFWVDNREILISVSIGISIFPNDGIGKDELIKNSETALFLCKEDRTRNYALFNKTQNEELINRIQIEKEIYKAIDKRAFTVYYQPKVNRNGFIDGAEALIRWYNGEKGMIPPGLFIPVSERNRSIIDIGEIVIEETFSHMKSWIDEGLDLVKISVNTASIQFSNQNFLLYVREMQKKYDIDPRWIEFEITETGIMENEKKTLEIMHELISMGYSISIDDFGTGYSSLNKLKEYPIEVIKIDKSFIDPLPQDESSSNIVKTIIDIAHFLSFKVVAEGVENKEQALLLNDFGCDLIQGFHYYKPMPNQQFVKLLNRSC